MRKSLLAVVAAALIGVPVASQGGVIYWDAAASYCSNNISGVTCCTKKTIDADEKAGAKVAQTIQQCAVGQSFFVKIPYPRDATSNTLYAVARIGNATTDAGLQCYEVSPVALVSEPGASDHGVLNLNFPTATNTTIAVRTTAPQTEAWRSRPSGVDPDGAVTLHYGSVPLSCASAPAGYCHDASVYVKFTRTSSPSAAIKGSCTDSKAGDGFISDGYFIY